MDIAYYNDKLGGFIKTSSAVYKDKHDGSQRQAQHQLSLQPINWNIGCIPSH